MCSGRGGYPCLIGETASSEKASRPGGCRRQEGVWNRIERTEMHPSRMDRIHIILRYYLIQCLLPSLSIGSIWDIFLKRNHWGRQSYQYSGWGAHDTTGKIKKGGRGAINKEQCKWSLRVYAPLLLCILRLTARRSTGFEGVTSIPISSSNC